MLKGQYALVTGAGSGIGKAIALGLAEQGCSVAVVDISEERLNDVVTEINKIGVAIGEVVDVQSVQQVEDLFKRVLETFPTLDIVVNCAGVYDGYAGITETSYDLWNKVIDINLTGAFYICKNAVEVMISKNKGRIINISSVGGLRGSADGISYTTSKFGLIGMTKRLAVDLGQYGITVNAVCPGVIQTSLRATSSEILEGIAPDMNNGVGVSQSFLDQTVPLKRKGLASEVADLVTYLSSDKSSYITGQAIPVDGGWTAT